MMRRATIIEREDCDTDLIVVYTQSGARLATRTFQTADQLAAICERYELDESRITRSAAS